MSYLRVNVDNENKEFVERLLQQLGYEVTEEPKQKTDKKKQSHISPTLLFAKWKSLDIDPENFRKTLWGKRK
jgi:hypothetical protein